MKKLLTLMAVLFFLSAPNTYSQICNGDFDCDHDVDGTDAVTFKNDFWRKDCPDCIPAPVPKTGQTTSYYQNDDGDLERGIADPVPRFTNPDGSFPVTDNMVLDNLTGLIWTRLALYSSPVEWTDTFSLLSFMNHGTYSDWRLPNLKELQSLINYGSPNPALPSAHPFDDTNQNAFWTSTTCDGDSDYAWSISTETGEISLLPKTFLAPVWPVRGGQ